MKVRARWNVKDGSGWHDAGDVFETTSDLGDAVEILEAPKKQEQEKPVKPEPVVKEETVQPKSTTTRRKTSK